MGLIRLNDQALEAYSKHSQDLKLATTRIQVEKTVRVAYKWSLSTRVFTVVSHSVRACGYIPWQPLQCVENKQSKCIWSMVEALVGNFKSGQKLPGKVHPNKKLQDQHCGPEAFLSLSTSRKL